MKKWVLMATAGVGVLTLGGCGNQHNSGAGEEQDNGTTENIDMSEAFNYGGKSPWEKVNGKSFFESEFFRSAVNSIHVDSKVKDFVLNTRNLTCLPIEYSADSIFLNCGESGNMTSRDWGLSITNSEGLYVQLCYYDSSKRQLSGDYSSEGLIQNRSIPCSNNDNNNYDPYPYTAVLNCSPIAFENRGIPIVSCMSNDYNKTTLRLRKNGELQVLQGWQTVDNADIVYTNRGYEIALTNEFEIKIQNASDILLMSMSIYDNRGNLIYEEVAEKYDTIGYTMR